MPPPDDSEWGPPRWWYISRHHSRANETWEQLLNQSRGREGNGIYRINRDEVRQAELETIGNLNQSVAPLGHEIRPRKASHERHFWREFVVDIGASKGERTRYIYVLYHLSGAVHGYPITETLLREKGVDDA